MRCEPSGCGVVQHEMFPTRLGSAHEASGATTVEQAGAAFRWAGTLPLPPRSCSGCGLP